MKQSILFQLLGKTFQVISTIDHPYTSPPIHLFDAHLHLSQVYGSNVLILNWDVSLPGDRTYRYDFITDTGLIAKLSSLYHYEPEISYSSQTLNQEPWELLPQCIIIAAKALKNKYCLLEKSYTCLRERAFAVLNIAKNSYHTTPWLYTRNLLTQLYSLFGKPELGMFIEQQYINYWLSPIMTAWIPWCILNVDGILSIQNLLKNNLFIRRPFRYPNHQWLEDPFVQDNQLLAEQISKGNIIPSLDVFLWSLAVVKIKHYGNDFGFFRKLANFSGIQEIANLQLTYSGEDAFRFMKLSKDYGVLLTTDQNLKIILSDYAYQPSKPTRINSFFSLYVIGGDNTIEYLQKYSQNLSHEKIIELD